MNQILSLVHSIDSDHFNYHILKQFIRLMGYSRSKVHEWLKWLKINIQLL